MRCSEDRALALECLKLACGGYFDPVQEATRYFAFVSGADTDTAKAKLNAVREIISEPAAR